MKELKNCPFCGSDSVYPLFDDETASDKYRYWVICIECSAEIYPRFENQKAAFFAWNARVERKCINEEHKPGCELINDNGFLCSMCGCELPFNELALNPKGHRRTMGVHMSYCPNCGARIIND